MKCSYHTKWCDKWHCRDANHTIIRMISTHSSIITPLVWYTRTAYSYNIMWIVWGPKDFFFRAWSNSRTLRVLTCTNSSLIWQISKPKYIATVHISTNIWSFPRNVRTNFILCWHDVSKHFSVIIKHSWMSIPCCTPTCLRLCQHWQ